MREIPKFVDLPNMRAFHPIANSFKICYFFFTDMMIKIKEFILVLPQSNLL